MDPDHQHQLFREAVELLGGQRPTARALGINERTVRMLVAGERALHTGFLRDIGKALTVHAARCREVERQLTPAFSANLTETQLNPPNRRGEHWRKD